MPDFKEAQRIIMEAIRPRTLPLAFNLLDQDDAFPEKTKRPGQMLKKRITICQGVTMARVYGWTVGLKKEDIICVPALVAWGMSGAEDQKDELAGLFNTVGFAENREVAQSQVADMSCPSEGEVGGILLSPLERAQREPDSLVIYCNPAQAMRLVQGINYLQDTLVTGSFAGKVECIETLYAAYKLDKPRIAIPGMGDRIFSMTQDDELVVSIPARLLPDLLKGLTEAGRSIGAKYPVPFYQNFEPQFPPQYGELAGKLKLFED
jgi:uncharacterized protein (DUF169 family)